MTICRNCIAAAPSVSFPPDLRVSPASYRPVPECRLIQIAADATLHRRMSAVRPMCRFSCSEQPENPCRASGRDPMRGCVSISTAEPANEGFAAQIVKPVLRRAREEYPGGVDFIKHRTRRDVRADAICYDLHRETITEWRVSDLLCIGEVVHAS